MIVIRKGSLNKVSVSEIFKYRYFIYCLFLRNISTIYKQTVFGPLWQIINPLIQSLVFTLVFANIAKIPTNEIPPFLFYSSAMLCWVFFQSTLTKSSESFFNFASYIRNAYIPKITIVCSLILENIFIFAINFAIFFFIYFLYLCFNFDFNLNPWLLLILPIVLIYLSLLATSIGLIIACLSAKFRDLRFISQYSIQILFYGTPIIYSINNIPEKYKFFFYFNPLTFFVDYFRNIFFSNFTLDVNLLYSSIFIFIILFLMAKKLYCNIVGNVSDYV